MSKTKLYRIALSTYGAEAQTLMAMEEMAELQKELCKHARGWLKYIRHKSWRGWKRDCGRDKA